MRSYSVVVPPPLLDQDTSLPQCVENLPVQQLIPQLPDERLDVSVLPRTARLDEQRSHAKSHEPLPNRLGAEFRPVVRPDMGRNAPADEQVRQGVENIMGVDPPPHDADASALTLLMIFMEKTHKFPAMC